jgi:hypothetical protein
VGPDTCIRKGLPKQRQYTFVFRDKGSEGAERVGTGSRIIILGGFKEGFECHPGPEAHLAQSPGRCLPHARVGILEQYRQSFGDTGGSGESMAGLAQCFGRLASQVGVVFFQVEEPFAKGPLVDDWLGLGFPRFDLAREPSSPLAAHSREHERQVTSERQAGHE